MRLTESKINPLKEFLTSLTKGDEWTILNSNNLPIMALYFNSGGVVFETHEEVVKGLELLAELGLVEIKENKLRITEYGKAAL